MKIAVIGFGSVGKRHVQNLLSIPHMQIVICTKQKIVNPSPNRVRIVNSISECLKEKPDVGIIANVSNLHIPTAIKLAKAGIDLFIEKPLSNSLKQTKELVSLVRKKKIITQRDASSAFTNALKKLSN